MVTKNNYRQIYIANTRSIVYKASNQLLSLIHDGNISCYKEL